MNCELKNLTKQYNNKINNNINYNNINNRNNLQ